MGEFDEVLTGGMQLDFGDDEVTFDWNDEVSEDTLGSEFDEEDILGGMPPSKKSMTIFFLIDTSGSMEGTKIGTVNATMEELLPDLIGVGGTETDIFIGVLQYASSCRWMTQNYEGNPGTVQIEEYQNWERLHASGLTAMGDAFKELCSRLSRNSFMNKPSLSYAPVIFLMSDGAPTDDYREGLKQLQNNNWFRYGLKIAVGIGSKPDMRVLREFTGNEELAIQAHGARELRDLIKLLAVTSSMIGSKSMSITEEGREKTPEDVRGDKEKQLIEEVASELSNIKDNWQKENQVKDIMGGGSGTEMIFEDGW